MDQPVDLAKVHLRIARPSDDLEAVVQFYRDGLGFDVLYEARGHDDFDVVMLGRKGTAYHLEFTHKAGHQVGRAPTQDNLLVFYLPDAAEWQRAVARLARPEALLDRRRHYIDNVGLILGTILALAGAAQG